MKRLLLMGTLMFLVTAVTVFASCLENSKSVVPENYLKVIKSADSVSFVMIDPWVEDAKDWMDGYGEVLSWVTIKDKGIIQSAYNLFSDPKSFEIHDVVKNCAHMPDAVIIFHSKKGDVKVSYSFYCDVCRFAQGEKYDEFDGETIRKEFLEVVQKAYPKDRYVRYLIKREKSNFK